MLEELELDTEDRVKAFTHPYRMKLLHALKELQAPATATDVARSIGDGPGKVHYHMRILADAGIVVLARTEVVNGIIARYYEPAALRFHVKGDAFGTGTDVSLRDGVAKLITMRFRDGLKAFLERTTSPDAIAKSGAAVESGGFLFDCTLHCTDADWQLVRETLEELASRFEKRAEGTAPRKVFFTGASDLPGSPAIQGQDSAPSGAEDAAVKAEGLAARKPVFPAANTRWTFGITLPGAPGNFRRFIPPL